MGNIRSRNRQYEFARSSARTVTNELSRYFPKRMNRTANRLKLWGKWALFPGLDLHTHCRYRFLPRFFRSGAIDTLDAGCGNGALAYAAYRRGNRVLGVTIAEDQIRQKFDQIICTETLEHIARDKFVVEQFYDLLRDGGVLHLACPFSNHPFNRGRFDPDESNGWHVRDGYTLESYRALLEPVGFRIVQSAGLGSPLLVKLDTAVRSVWNRSGTAVALPLFLLTWPVQFLDYLNPRVPLSLYVQAVKNS
jgi:SAM-dependent methyltransferase